MHRTAVILIVLVTLLWQSVALARPGVSVNLLADPDHAALHWQEEGHHHHDDGSFHVDDSLASSFHLLCDHVAATMALLPASPQQVPQVAATRPGGLPDARMPAPFLDGLLRPPRRGA